MFYGFMRMTRVPSVGIAIQKCQNQSYFIGAILTFIRIQIVNKPKSVHVPIKIQTILFKTKF